ncbi:DEAD/DEAH box helicase [candidate division WOR-3 bacterium]|nr:DEAD/DEAH box helicase [candidate division WOR-3 bacterium]
MSNISSVLNSLRTGREFKQRIVHIEQLNPKAATYCTLELRLAADIHEYIRKNRILLYKHQCEVIEHAVRGHNVIVSTPTASGKTLAFNIPVFNELIQDSKSKALYLYPTKALSNDQLKVLKSMEKDIAMKIAPAIYDGDTPASRRSKIRESSRIIISNPYELHQILPWHYKWENFLSHLKYVVIDEAHQYRGVFGSNVAALLRRFRRICDFYGSKPTYILSSATLANPLEFSEKLTGLKFVHVGEDGSPKGKKYFVLYNPYFEGAGELSIHQETRKLLRVLVENDLQTLCFTISRRMAELIASWVRKDLRQSEPSMAAKVTSYRAGYLPQERREIENALKDRMLRGLTATNALELGIDIGSLDAVIISGYPGSMISTWQQAGRAGRGVGESLVVLVAFENALDQYFMQHPDVFFGGPTENAVVDLANPYIASGHILCAAAEMPIDAKSDAIYFSEDLEEILSQLEAEQLTQKTRAGWVYSGEARATEVVQINNISSEIFKVVCDGELLETMDRAQAYREAHKGAVLFHQGETYVVEKMDLDNMFVHAKRKSVDYHTQALRRADIKIEETFDSKKVHRFTLYHGRINVTEVYDAYKIIKYDKQIGTQLLSLPPLHFETTAFWFTLPEEIVDEIRKKNLNFMGGLHGAEHILANLMPLHVICDQRDIGGLSTSIHQGTQKPTIFVYDGFEGGIGLSEKVYEIISDLAKMAYDLVRHCKCESGCPACIQSPHCGDDNRPLDKQATLIVLKEFL